jgi:uncharacterized membrane protein YcaP (DUF421 family)
MLEPNTSIVLIATFCAAAMIIVRIAGRRKTGGKAIFMELLYLFFYAFMGGAVFYFSLSSMYGGDIMWAIGFFFFFWGGFSIRAFKIYKMLTSEGS